MGFGAPKPSLEIETGIEKNKDLQEINSIFEEKLGLNEEYRSEFMDEDFQKILNEYFNNLDKNESLEKLELVKSNESILLDLKNSKPFNKGEEKIKINNIFDNYLSNLNTKEILNTEEKNDKREKNLELIIKTQEISRKVLSNPKLKDFRDQQRSSKEVQKAKEHFIKQGVPEENLDDYVDAFIFMNNQEAFTSIEPNLENDFKELKSIIEKDETFRPLLIVNHLKENSHYMASQIQHAGNALAVGTEKIEYDMDRTKVEVKSGDETVVLEDGKGTRKYIEQNGFKLDSTVDFDPGYDYILEREKLKKDYNNTIGEDTHISSTGNALLERQKEIEELREMGMGDEDLDREYDENNTKLVQLKSKKEELTQGLKDIQEEAKTIEQRERDRLALYRMRQKEEDQKTRETLAIVGKSGFDAIDQRYTSQIISMLKQANSTNVDLGGGLYLNVSEFDLDKDNFGLPDTQGGRKAELLARFMNKIITGEGKGESAPINVDNVTAATGVGISNKTEFKKQLDAIMVNGAFNFEIVMSNLLENKQENKQENNMEKEPSAKKVN